MDFGKLNKCMFSIDLHFKILLSLMNYTQRVYKSKMISWINDKSFSYGEG